MDPGGERIRIETAVGVLAPDQNTTALSRYRMSMMPREGPLGPTEKRSRILLVEDNADSAAMMKMLLESFAYEVETAGDVAEALKAIELRSFDVLISDLGLPDQSGIELMQELRRRGNAIKSIALSGYGREEDVKRSREAGFDLHLTKPVDAEALVQAISRVV
jgi:CheY-like chemotaxis protein